MPTACLPPRKDSESVKLYHATPRRNLESIKRNGLDPNLAKGKEALIWLHTASRRDWAILHTINRHKSTLEDVAIIEINVPRTRLRRKWRGIWTTGEPITELKSITTASELAESH